MAWGMSVEPVWYGHQEEIQAVGPDPLCSNPGTHV